MRIEKDKCDNCPLRDAKSPCIGQSPTYAQYCKTHCPLDRIFIVEESEIWRKQLKLEDNCKCHAPLIAKPRKPNPSKEVVVARFKEDTSWVNDLPYNVIVYDKCPGSNDVVYNDNIIVRHLENKGREAGTYLQHICENYDSLAEWTYFLQGCPHSDDLLDRLAYPYGDSTSLTQHYTVSWPGDQVTKHDLIQLFDGFEVRLGDARFHGDRSPQQNKKWIDSVWETWFVSKQPDRLYYGYGAEIAVPRHRILARPLSFWQLAKETVLASSQATEGYWAGNPGSAWGLETIWLYLFGDCDLYKVRQSPLKSKDCNCGKKRIEALKKANQEYLQRVKGKR